MSKLIKIISIKTTKESLSYTLPRIRLSEYANSLSETAKDHPGFISTDSYWKNKLKNPTITGNESLQVVSISEWESLRHWNQWLQSEERNKIHNQYKDIIQKESFSVLNKRSFSDDTFLL